MLQLRTSSIQVVHKIATQLLLGHSFTHKYETLLWKMGMKSIRQIIKVKEKRLKLFFFLKSDLTKSERKCKHVYRGQRLTK